MQRIADFSIPFNRLWLIAPFLLALSLHGCAVMKPAPVQPPVFQGVPEETIKRNDFPVAKEDDVIGQLASMRLAKGDTLPDVARHFSLGINEIGAANPGVDTWVPEADKRIVLPLSHILPDCPRKGIVINLASMRLFHFKGNGKSPAVSTYPVGIGTAERPSPTGPMYVRRKTVKPTWIVPVSISEDHRKKGDLLPPKVLPGPENPLGEYALYLSKPSYLIHGTNKPYSIGLNATNGCIRLYPEDVKKLYDGTPVNTPVLILNQPYLVGQHNGVVYLEVHAPPGGRDAAEMEKAFAKLKNIEKKLSRRIDWTRVEETFAEARGVPVPISEIGQEKGTAEVVEVRHPEKLYGRPEVPEMKKNAWYVSAANLSDKIEAARLAAIINHQGPQIPARVLPKSDSYRVLAGPFNNVGEAREAVKRLKIDLEIEAILVEPSREG
jgi:L,D-transpeptidase ErfK/SrfK